MNNKLRKRVDELNRLLAVELGAPKPDTNGSFAWIWSESKQLQIGMKTGNKTVWDKDAEIFKVVPVYEWRPTLPNHEDYKNIWVMCFTEHRIGENEWWKIFGTELPQVTYWKPVQCDAMLNSVAGRETSRERLIQFVTAGKNKEPDQDLTWKFIKAVREARELEKLLDPVAITQKLDREKHQKLVDYYRWYALPSFLQQGGKKNHAFMPATVTKDGRIIK